MDPRNDVRNRLLRRRAELVGLHEETNEAARGILDERGSEPRELATSVGAAGVIDFLAEVELKELGEIDAALARLERGTYGTCSSCGQEIDARRLRALPHTTSCVGCARS